MPPITQICAASGKQFVVDEQDQAYYARIGVPLPTLCPEERRRRRYSHRNERHLYKRKCDATGKDIISNYRPDSDFTVYEKDAYWSDKWDARDYGVEFDFTRPFFEQYNELQKKVPQLALSVWNSENSEYCNYVGHVKDCYLIFGPIFSEKCYYGSPYYSFDCLDTLVVRECKHCYECIDCRKLYECFYCQDCHTSNGLIHCYDCQGCSDCIGCAGLRNKKHHIFNKPVSKEEFKKFKASLDEKNIQKELEKLKLRIPHRFMQSKQVENVSGNYVFQSKNALDCYFTDRSEDVRYCMQVVDLKDCYDNNFTEENELCYEYIGSYQNNRVLFSKFLNQVSESFYCDSCFSSKNLFGCISMRNAQYCILNKQYTREEYEEFVPKIIEHMKKTKEWGEFFPMEISPFKYEETVADEYFPSQKQEGKASEPFNLIPQEREFYKKMNLKAPKIDPNQRHRDRLAKRNPQEIWTRQCSKCKTEIQTTYSPDRPEKVYCEQCYLAEVY